MSAITPCTPCCATPQTVNIPGLEGLTGNNGTNGRNAFTLTTADFVVPNAINGTVAIQVGDTSWMVVGQTLIVGQGLGGALLFPGPATFKVDSITSLTGFVGKWLQYSGDVAPNTTIGSGTGTGGAVVTPSGGTFTSPLPIAGGGTGAGSVSAALAALGVGQAPITVYGSGATYVITASQQAVTMGGTSPSLVLTQAGTYLIFSRIRYDYQGKTFAANHVLTAKLRRTNNTAGDLSNANASIITPIITTVTESIVVPLPPVVYQTTNTNDAIALYAGINALPAEAGTVEVSECEIVAMRIF